MSGKMIRTFDAKSYTDLLVRYQPKPIANEAENEAAKHIEGRDRVYYYQTESH